MTDLVLSVLPAVGHKPALEIGPSNVCAEKPFMWFWYTLKFENHWRKPMRILPFLVLMVVLPLNILFNLNQGNSRGSFLGCSWSRISFWSRKRHLCNIEYQLLLEKMKKKNTPRRNRSSLLCSGLVVCGCTV